MQSFADSLHTTIFPQNIHSTLDRQSMQHMPINTAHRRCAKQGIQYCLLCRLNCSVKKQIERLRAFRHEIHWCLNFRGQTWNTHSGGESKKNLPAAVMGSGTCASQSQTCAPCESLQTQRV